MRARVCWLVGVVVTAVLLGAACSSGASVAAPTGSAVADEVLAATAVPATATAVPAPTATAAPEPTATEVPAPEPTMTPEPAVDLMSDDEFVALVDSEIDEIRELHTRFMTELLARDERTAEGVDRFRERSQELTAGTQLDVMLQRLDARQARGEFIDSPGYLSYPERASALDGNVVRVFDCSADRAVLYGADGEVISESEGLFERRSTDIAMVDGLWRVVLFITDWDEPCEPQ